MERRMPGRPASSASNSGALNPTTTLGRTARSCSRESLPPKNRSSPTVSPRPASSTMRPSSSMTSIRPLTTRWIASGGSSTSPRPSSSQAADSETWSRSASSSGPRTGCRLHSSSRRCIRSRASRSGADRSAQLSTSPPGTFARTVASRARTSTDPRLPASVCRSSSASPGARSRTGITRSRVVSRTSSRPLSTTNRASPRSPARSSTSPTWSSTRSATAPRPASTSGSTPRRDVASCRVTSTPTVHPLPEIWQRPGTLVKRRGREVRPPARTARPAPPMLGSGPNISRADRGPTWRSAPGPGPVRRACRPSSAPRTPARRSPSPCWRRCSGRLWTSPRTRVALVTAAVLCGQLSIGWSNDLVDLARDRAVGRRDKPLARRDREPADRDRGLRGRRRPVRRALARVRARPPAWCTSAAPRRAGPTTSA